MLIIAQPKSASTSLLKTIAKLTKTKSVNGLGKSNRQWEYCEGFSEIQKYHDTTIKRSYDFLNSWISTKRKIYKDHILPTKDHIKKIKKIDKNIVILLRNPDNTLDNYKRLLYSYNSGELSKAEINELRPDRLATCDIRQFKSDIALFKAGWEDAKIGKALYIDFDELVMCPYRICKQIVEHFGFSMPKIKNFALEKAKGNHGYNTYTGVGYDRAKKNWETNNCY